MNDIRIIELFFERSESAISELSEKYGNLIFKISENVLNNRQDAEECVNDTYLSVWNTIPPEKPASLMSFVCRIARNISVDRYRYNSSKKRGVYDLCYDELRECIPSYDTVESLFEEKEIGGLIDIFLDTLDKKNRLLFVRRYWYMDSIRDLASETNLSQGAVRTRLSRLREKLKEFLESRGVSV